MQLIPKISFIHRSWSHNKYDEHTLIYLVLNFTFRGRHASKITEEEEDEEYLKEEEDGLTGSGNTRLLTQPSCKYLYFAL